MARAWFEKREQVSARVLRAARRLVLWTGRRRALVLLWPVTLYFYVVSPDARRGISRFYERLFGDKPLSGRVLRHFYVFAQTILDRAYLLTQHPDAPRCEIRGFEAVSEYLARGQGCVLLGAHIGSFEAARAAALTRPELRMQVIMHTEISRKLDEALAPPDRPDAAATLGSALGLLGIKEWLDKGGLVGMMGDRALADEATQGRHFLGATAEFPMRSLRLAAALQAPVFFFAALYKTAVDGSRYYEVVFDELSLAAPSGHERSFWVQVLGERYTAALQKFCRIAPDNWFNFYDFWHAPAGRPSTLGLHGKSHGVRGYAPLDRAPVTTDPAARDKP